MSGLERYTVVAVVRIVPSPSDDRWEVCTSQESGKQKALDILLRCSRFVFMTSIGWCRKWKENFVKVHNLVLLIGYKKNVL